MKDFFVVSCHVFQHLPSANTILIFYMAKNLIAIKKLHLTEMQDPHKAPHGHCSVINCSCPCFFTARKRSLGQGNIFRSVCKSFCSEGGLCMMSLPVWYLVPCFFSLQGVCVPGPMFLLGNLCLGALCPGALCPGGLCREIPPLRNKKSRRYAYYWNAFLCLWLFAKKSNS